ncbi:MAG: metallophosphoesterase [Oscillospiraceae bacterium]|nr:metallophosphoesterase [Oscillospiraceae bacterium]
MKILTISDEECPALWDFYTPGRLDGYDLILSCGDLNSKYLSFLVTMAKCPVLYVHGNHDATYKQRPPEGCDCIDDHIVTYNGVRILGLGGCRKYHPGPHQYTEAQMRRRIARLRWKLRRMGGVDIVVTHAPPEDLGDADDIAHWGFAALRELIDKYQPKYLVHGHVHMSYGYNIPREIDHNGTRIINAYERYTIEIPEGQYKGKDWNQVIYKTKVRNDDFESLILK